MRKNDQMHLTEKNLDHLADILSDELNHLAFAEEIPTGAHLFYGSRSDTALTQANLQLVSKILLSMTLGYIKDAPLVMIFEYEPGRRTVIDLSDETQKGKARTFIQGFQEQSRREMGLKIGELVPA